MPPELAARLRPLLEPYRDRIDARAVAT